MKTKTQLKWVVCVVLCFAAYFGLGKVVNMAKAVDSNQGYRPVQPIAFSHKVHALDNEISCLYCHYSARKSRHASIPPLNLCMNCHTQIKKDSAEIKKIKNAMEAKQSIEWIKVHRLSDFVYFNHAQHVVVGKVACQECHGNVEKMARVEQISHQTMGWCIDCHRKNNVGGHESKSPKLLGGLDCAKCHY